MSDEHEEVQRLAAQWKLGDRSAFETLILRLHGPLRQHVAALCDSRDLVDEVLQQTFITCFQKIDAYENRGPVIAWLKAIARNHLMDHWRERHRRAGITGDLPEQTISQAILDDVEDPDLSAERGRRLAACLERLPDRARQLMERRHLDQRPLAEMARHFKQTVAHLSVTLHRIRQSLRRCIESSS